MVCKPIVPLLAALWAAAQASTAIAAEEGQATWHIFGEEVACPGDFGTTRVFALDARLFAQSASKCGMCAVVTGRKGSVVARFVDRCVGSACKDMDLSQDAFRLIADVSEGITDIKFSDLRPCGELQRLHERELGEGGATISALLAEDEEGAPDTQGGKDAAAAAPAAADSPAAADQAARNQNGTAADRGTSGSPPGDASRRPAEGSGAASAATLASLSAMLPLVLAARSLI